MIRNLRNERGNVVLLTLGILSVMVLMFLVLSNFVKAFSVKQQAMTSAELASFAATSVIYEQVGLVIEDYDRRWNAELEALERVIEQLKNREDDEDDDDNDDNNDDDHDLIHRDDYEYLNLEGVNLKSLAALEAFVRNSKSLDARIETRTEEIKNRDRVTTNEAKLMAINEVLSSELRAPNKNIILGEELLDALNAIGPTVEQAVRSAVTQNNGTINNTDIHMFNSKYRVEVKTSVRYEAKKYDHVIPESKRQIRQTGQGPTVEFVKYLDGWSNSTYELGE